MARDSRDTKRLPDNLARMLPSINLTFTLGHELVPNSGLHAVQVWDVVATAYDPEDMDEEGNAREETVGTMCLVKGDLGYTHLWEHLDAIDSDLDAVASQVLARNFFTEDALGEDDPPDELSSEVLEVVDGVVGSSLLIAQSAVLADHWRGHGIGRLLVGQALLTLGGDARCVAGIPAPLDDSEGEERQRAIRKLERVWAELAFKPLPRGVWVLDPAKTELADAVAGMRQRLGLPG